MHRDPSWFVRSPGTARAIRPALILALLAGGLIALIALAGGPARAQSTAGVIAFTGPDHNIWRIAADGSDRRQLTQDGSSDYPSWTLDGTQIVFASIREHQVISTTEGAVTASHIFAMDANGGNAHAISSGMTDDRLPGVAPGSGRVVFYRNHNWRLVGGGPARDTDVVSMRPDGSDARVLGSQVTTQGTRIDRYPPAVAPDGSAVAVIRQVPGQNSEILMLDPSTGHFTTLAPEIDQGATPGTVEYLWPRFDPQGRLVVLRRVYTYGPVDVGLIRMDRAGKNTATLLGHLQYESLADGYDVNWDARTVVAARAPQMPGGLNPEEIYLIDLDTGTAGPPIDSGHAPSLTLTGGQPAAPTALPTAPPAPTQPAPPPGTPAVTPPPAPTGTPLIDTPDPLFYDVWERVDRPVKEGGAARSWIWGPVGRAVEHEPYGNGTRLVQYFDKARMELNPAANGNPAYVTNGLLVVEMLSGQIQIGPTQYQSHPPATAPIGGDGAANPAPSFATLATVASLAGENQAAPALHSPVTATLSADGQIGHITFPATERIGYYAKETGHNIPEVFFNFLNQTGKVWTRGGYHSAVILDWVYTVGYPITEPYWTRMSVAGKVQDVMIQAFQRQVLTYIPAYQAPWNVQFGNVGLQYYQWRYGHLPPGAQP